MKLLFINNVRLSLAQPLSDTDTNMVVSKAEEPYNDPIIDSNNPDFSETFIRLTIVDDLEPEKIEIVTVTDLIEETATTYQFAITRGEEDTQAQSFDSDAIVYMAHTAEAINRGHFKDSSVTATIGTFGDQAIPVETGVFGVVSESITLTGAWKTISRPQGVLTLDIRVSDFGASPTPADSILNGNPISITNTEYSSGVSADIENFFLEKGKVISVVILSTDSNVEWISLTLDGRVLITTDSIN